MLWRKRPKVQYRSYASDPMPFLRPPSPLQPPMKSQLTPTVQDQLLEFQLRLMFRLSPIESHTKLQCGAESITQERQVLCHHRVPSHKEGSLLGFASKSRLYGQFQYSLLRILVLLHSYSSFFSRSAPAQCHRGVGGAAQFFSHLRT